MGYFIRLFATVPLSSLIPIQAQMLQRGFQVQPAGTNQLDIIFDANSPPLTVDLTDSNMQKTRDEIRSFLAEVSRVPDDSNKQKVLDVLARTQAVVFVGIPDELTDEFSDTLDNVLDGVANSADGLFHIDGEGFYEGSTLILPVR